MALPFQQHLFPPVKRALREYKMLKEGDHVAIGVSGGKDSLTALYALALLRRVMPYSFKITAITIDLGFEQADWSGVASFCEQLEVPLKIVPTQIATVLFDIRQESNPCSLCSKLRHGALNNEALRQDCNIVALGHHREDAIETMFMNMLYNGRIDCFQPVTWLDRREISLIRPLIYVSEDTTRMVAAKLPLPVNENPCPANGATQRQHVKELLARETARDRIIPKRLLRAVKSLWH